MNYETLRFEIDTDHRVATLTLDRPASRNALDTRMGEEIAHVVERLRAGDGARMLDVRALVLRGEGEAFCAGGDIRSMSQARSAALVRHRLQRLHGWYADLLDVEVPVIAAVQGPAYGAGLSLALAADFIVASPKASFCAVFARMGLVPDLGLLHVLPRWVGLPRAKEMMLSTRAYGAADAKAIGLVHEIVAHDALDTAATALARRFTHASMSAIGMSKVLLNRSYETDARTMAQLEGFAQGAAAGTAEHHEAVARFLAKQPLQYSGFQPRDWLPEADSAGAAPHDPKSR